MWSLSAPQIRSRSKRGGTEKWEGEGRKRRRGKGKGRRKRGDGTGTFKGDLPPPTRPVARISLWGRG